MFYVYFKGKRGTLDVASAYCHNSGRSCPWLARRTAMGGDIFLFPLGLGWWREFLAACVRDMKKRMYIRQLREMQIKYAMTLRCYDYDGTGFT